MNFHNSILLGLLQGTTEFLPVSSSAHLVLAELLINEPHVGLAYDVALHMGTLVGLVVYFFQDFLQMARFLLPGNNGAQEARRFYRQLAGFIVLGTVPAVFFGLLWGKEVESLLRAPLPIAAALAGGGLLLVIAEQYGRRLRPMNQLRLIDSLLIGLSQALAIMPGVSRSGITITAGLFLGLERKAAARFSFLLSAPVILGAGVYHLPGLLKEEWLPGQLGFYLVGFLAAAVSGYFCIAFLIRFVQTRSLAVFAYYRFALAGLIVLLLAL
ncbi:MAG: undecaprenyl-diphosphatase UppP [Desulfobacterales bacterium]|nr:undecaprenyl-diphosphatase UppP [Desulfobacterales bacterium]